MERGPVYIRVKLCFEDPPLDTPKCLWYLISTRSCRFISDVCYSIQKRFLDEKESISLTMDDYAVPMEESVHLLQDNDVLRLVLSTVLRYLIDLCSAHFCILADVSDWLVCSYLWFNITWSMCIL